MTSKVRICAACAVATMGALAADPVRVEWNFNDARRPLASTGMAGMDLVKRGGGQPAFVDGNGSARSDYFKDFCKDFDAMDVVTLHTVFTEEGVGELHESGEIMGYFRNLEKAEKAVALAEAAIRAQQTAFDRPELSPREAKGNQEKLLADMRGSLKEIRVKLEKLAEKHGVARPRRTGLTDAR